MMANEHVQSVCLATTICLVIFLLLRTWKRRHIYYRAAKVKGPFPLPVIGSTYVLWGHTQDLLEGLIRLNEKYGSLYKFWTGTELCFFASKPEEVQIVLNSCAEKYQDMKYLNPVFGKGLLTLPAPEWKIHRKLLRGTFSQEILNSFVKTYVVYSNIMVGKLEESLGKGLVDVFPLFSLCMTDILCDTMMGVQVNTMKENGYNLILQTARLGELGCLRTANPLLHPDILWNRTSLSKETRTILEEVQQFIKKIVETKRLEKAQNVACASQKPILLNRMLELEDTEEMWDEQMSLEETQAVLVAGADATTLTLGYVLMMLGMHQEIQTQVHQELDFVFGVSNRDVTLEDLLQLQLLERVIKETLRIFPVAPLVGRYLTKDIVLENVVLPEGSTVYIPIICVHRDGNLWPEPLKFDPDRFLPSEVAKRHPFSYFPFSGGPRKCLGPRYAMMVITTVLATILRHYKVVETGFGEISEIEMKLDVSGRCVKGQNVKLEKRFVEL